jgi:hypothetical protein
MKHSGCATASLARSARRAAYTSSSNHEAWRNSKAARVPGGRIVRGFGTVLMFLPMRIAALGSVKASRGRRPPVVAEAARDGVVRPGA